MSQNIAVESTVEKNGRVRIRRIKIDERWLAVEQGRQWVDEIGRHVLIIVPGGNVQEILLSSHSLNWELVSKRGSAQIV